MVIKAHRHDGIPLYAIAGGNSSVDRLLLDWSRSFSNFDANLARAALFGWSEAIDIPCSWSGIFCQEGHFSVVFMDDNATLNGKLSCFWGSFA